MTSIVHEVYFDKDPDTGEEGDFSQQVEFPARWEICYDCDGEGKTYLGLRARDQPAFTAEDFYREGPDFREDYMSGNYDAHCCVCEGSGKIKVIDEKACITPLLKAALNSYHDYLQCKEDDRKTRLAEMGLRA